MQLFYNPLLKKDDQSVTFDKQESGHIIKVLRKAKGDILHITNGMGFLFEGEIISANHNKCLVKIKNITFHENLKYHLHIAIAPTKRNERFEWFLEKATEIGIHEITPLICEHSERKKIKIDRYERVIQSAMKQSLQFYKPQIHDPLSFKEFMAQDRPEQKYIAHCEETQKTYLKNELEPFGNYLILIGPEGDFSTSEINTALKKGYAPVSLGETRLRTETAAIVACHTASLINL